MTELKIYKALTYILVLPNVILGFITFFGLIASIFNPAMFFGMILFVGVVFYAIASFIFLQKGIINNAICSFKLKKNIRTTSILTVLFCIMCLMNCFTLAFNSSSMEIIVNNFLNDGKNALPPNVTRGLLTKAIWASVYFLGIYAALLLLHTLMTYKFTKLYANLFAAAK